MDNQINNKPTDLGLAHLARADPTYELPGYYELSASSKAALGNYAMKEFSWENNGFIWLILSDAMRNLLISNTHDICKLMYLSCTMDYDGKIVKSGKSNDTATKRDIESVLGIKETARKQFVKTMIDLCCINQRDSGLYVGEHLFRRGTLPNRLISEVQKSGGRIFRTYASSIGELYWKKNSKGDSSALRYLVAMVPYIHSKYNILCFNPDETNPERILPMNFSDFCDQIGYDRTHVSRMSRIVAKTAINDKKRAELSIIRCKPKEFGIKKSCIFVNPRIFFAGNYDSLLIIQQIFAKYGGILSDTEKAE